MLRILGQQEHHTPRQQEHHSHHLRELSTRRLRDHLDLLLATGSPGCNIFHKMYTMYNNIEGDLCGGGGAPGGHERGR